MKLRFDSFSLIVAAMILASSFTAGAQEFRVEVVEAATGKPIVGANVALLDSAGAIPLGGSFSDQSGHTDLRAPVRGPYRVRADKAGYDTWLSVQLHLADKPVHVRIGMAPTRTPAPNVARSEVACQQLTGPGTPAGDVWAELRKALSASAMTEAQGLVPLDVDLYERVLDPNLAIMSERTEQRNRVPRRPVTGISWEQIDTTRRGEGSSGDVYRAPDAATIISDQFVKTHCFAAIRGYGPESGLIGLEFRPTRVAGQAELSGVLWLEPKSKALRSLNFDYVNLPIPLRIARTTGRLEFQQLPGGQWIVPRWYIRMPRLVRVPVTSGNSPAVSRDSLLGYQEVGGEARPAGTARVSTARGVVRTAASGDSPDEQADANQTVLTGIVYDSSSGRPLSGVQVSTGGGRYKTTTNSGGRYELVIKGPLSDKIIFEHPRLRLLRVPDRVQSVSLAAGSRGEASVIVHSYGALRNSLCGRNETGIEAQGLMAGHVRDAAGKLVAGAHVWVTWQILWVERNGRLESTNQQRTIETDSDTDGSYVLCGFTRNAQVTAKVSVAGKNTLQERLTLPATMVLEKDFQFAAR